MVRVGNVAAFPPAVQPLPFPVKTLINLPGFPDDPGEPSLACSFANFVSLAMAILQSLMLLLRLLSKARTTTKTVMALLLLLLGARRRTRQAGLCHEAPPSFPCLRFMYRFVKGSAKPPKSQMLRLTFFFLPFTCVLLMLYLREASVVAAMFVPQVSPCLGRTLGSVGHKRKRFVHFSLWSCLRLPKPQPVQASQTSKPLFISQQ